MERCYGLASLPCLLVAGLLACPGAQAETMRIDCGASDVEDIIARSSPGIPRSHVVKITKSICPNGTGQAVWPKSVMWPSLACFPRESLGARIEKAVPDSLKSSSLAANIRAACERVPVPVVIEPGRSHIGAVEASRLMPGDRAAISLGADRTLRLWDLGSDGPPRLLHRVTKANSAINLALSPDSRQAVLNDEDDRPSIFDTESGRLITRLEGQSTFGGPAAYIGDGSQLLASASDYEMGVFDSSTGKLLRRLPPFRSTPRIAAASADGRVAAIGTAAGEIRVFLVETGRPLLVDERPSLSVFSFERGGSRLILGSQEKFDVFDLASAAFGAPLAFAPGTGHRGVGAAFLPRKDRALVCSRDLQEWDLAASRLVRTLATFPFQCTALSLSSDGKTALVSHDDSEMMLVDVESGRVVRTLGQPGPKSTRLEVSVR